MRELQAAEIKMKKETKVQAENRKQEETEVDIEKGTGWEHVGGYGKIE